jgi:hypothetical protein
LHGRQQNCNENANDGNNDEQLDQCERVATVRRLPAYEAYATSSAVNPVAEFLVRVHYDFSRNGEPPYQRSGEYSTSFLAILKLIDYDLAQASIVATLSRQNVNLGNAHHVCLQIPSHCVAYYC